VVPGSTIKLGSTINLPSFNTNSTFYPHNAMNNYKEHEQRIALAIKHLSTKTSYNLSAEARLFNVDVQRLRRRMNATKLKTTRPPTNQQLNPTQLKALELYID
jgi:hypothetical protein